MDYTALGSRCQNLRKIFAESISDEAISFGEEKRQTNKMRLILTQPRFSKSIWHGFGHGWAKNEGLE
jgi:hypothetical protein